MKWQLIKIAVSVRLFDIENVNVPIPISTIDDLII